MYMTSLVSDLLWYHYIMYEIHLMYIHMYLVVGCTELRISLLLAECALSFSVSLCMFIVYLCREAFGPIVGGAIVYNVGFPNMAAVRIMWLLIL